MHCDDIQEAILESFDEAPAPELRRQIDAHVSGCAACAAFARRQARLDATLSVALQPPASSPAFRSTLQRTIRRDTLRAWFEALPDLVHFISCGAATLACAVVLPLDTAVVLATGTIGTAFSYMALTVLRDSFDAAEQPDR